MAEHVALIRGINVGRAKRIAMADLRALVEGLGHANVRTLLNSGNVIFDGGKARADTLARGIRCAIEASCGFSAQVMVVRAVDLAAIVRDNPLREAIGDPSRFAVAFVSGRAVLADLQPLARQPWGKDRLAIGARAAYLSCPGGFLDSKLATTLMRQGGDAVTTRNWATVLKLLAATAGEAPEGP